MKTLMCQVLLTRRQDLSYILNEAGGLEWSGKSVKHAIEHLIETGEQEFRLVDGDDQDALHITARRA